MSKHIDTLGDPDLAFLNGGGEMGALMRRHDWSRTPLGPPSSWPQPLRTALRLILNSGHPMYIWWGPELLCFYNDAYRASIGSERHPSSLGMPGKAVWEEIWPIIGPQIEHVVAGLGATWNQNHLVPITRNGKLEDVYWTYSYSPIDDANAPTGVGGVLVVCSETTATVLAERRRAEEAARQHELFRQAPGFMIVMTGPEHRVEFVNDTHRQLFGSDDWIGQPIREAFPDIEAQGFLELLDGVYANGAAYRNDAAPVRFRRPSDGVEETRILDFIYAPILDVGGAPSGVFCQGFDVTDKKIAESSLSEREEQLRLAVEAGDIGLWDVDLVANTLFWPARVKAMFGISAEVPVTMDDFYAGLHPEDRAHTSAAFASALDPQLRAVYDVEYRTVGKEDGQVRFVAARGRGVFDSTGKCVRVIGTAIDITRRRLLEKSLQDSEEQLRDADRRKDEFLATLAHELRNPLSPLRNAGELLQRPSLDPSRVLDLGRMIARQTRTMATLLDDLLEVTRITTGKLQLRKANLDVASVVDTAIETVKPLLSGGNHPINLIISDPEARFVADPLRISQVLTNLLTNASKYSDPGSPITLRAAARDGQVVFEIEDHGIGLSDSQIPSIFRMFSQVPSANERAQGGLGIGLAVAKALVEWHGGTVGVTSPGLGHGTTFTVRLPQGDLLSEKTVDADIASTKPIQTAPVLIVDDNEDAAKTLAELLRAEGYDTHVAHDGVTALELVKDLKPAACFLDIGMPGMSGHDLAKAVREIHTDRPVLLVATTGWGMNEDRRRSREAGFDFHLTKPVDTSEAFRLLASWQA